MSTTKPRPVSERDKRDAWLMENRERINKAKIIPLAIEMRKLGFYSKKAPILTVYQSIHDACRRLGITL